VARARAEEQVEGLQRVAWAGVHPVEALVGSWTEADAVGADSGGDGLDDALVKRVWLWADPF